MGRIKVPVLTFVLGLIFSCTQPPGVSTLWTDIPELALYAEVYNASQSNFRIFPEFHSNPQELLNGTSQDADLVVGRLKMPPAPLERLSSLDFLFDRSGEPRKNFYQGILDQGQSQGIQILMPLSFDLPLIMGLKTSFPEDWPGLLVETGEIIRYSSTQNRPQKNPPVLGYSLRWSSQQTESLLYASGWVPNQTSTGELLFSGELPPSFFSALEALRTLNGGTFEDRFTSKYLPGLGFKLLSDSRVLFYPFTLQDYVSLPGGQRDQLDFRYPMQGGKVWALGNPVMMAMPKGSRQPQAAEDFAAWLLRKENQKRLLEMTADLQIRTFGFASGLSALPEVTETQISGTALGLPRPVPNRSEVVFPPSLPSEWTAFSKEVFPSWLNKYLEGHRTESLQDAYDRWKAEKNVDTREKPL